MKHTKYHTVGTILKYHTVGTILKYHTVGTIPKSNIKIVERVKMDTLYTQIHDRSLSWLGTDTSMNDRGVKLVLRAQNSFLSELMQSSKCLAVGYCEK